MTAIIVNITYRPQPGLTAVVGAHNVLSVRKQRQT